MKAGAGGRAQDCWGFDLGHPDHRSALSDSGFHGGPHPASKTSNAQVPHGRRKLRGQYHRKGFRRAGHRPAPQQWMDRKAPRVPSTRAFATNMDGSSNSADHPSWDERLTTRRSRTRVLIDQADMNRKRASEKSSTRWRLNHPAESWIFMRKHVMAKKPISRAAHLSRALAVAGELSCFTRPSFLPGCCWSPRPAPMPGLSGPPWWVYFRKFLKIYALWPPGVRAPR